MVVRLAARVPPAVPLRVMSPAVNPVTSSEKTMSKTIGEVEVGSAWPAPWLMVTSGGSPPAPELAALTMTNALARTSVTRPRISRWWRALAPTGRPLSGVGEMLRGHAPTGRSQRDSPPNRWAVSSADHGAGQLYMDGPGPAVDRWPSGRTTSASAPGGTST